LAGALLRGAAAGVVFFATSQLSGARVPIGSGAAAYGFGPTGTGVVSEEAGRFAPLPQDILLPTLPANGLDWTASAVILQPWGRTEWDAIVHAPERAPWLAGAFGFNTMIVLPPAAHNAITSPAEHVTEEEFERALGIYRTNGFRIIIYSSIMHCGHDPVWQDGTLEKKNPEWSQRGPKGEPVRIYGADWLCPSTGALAFTLDYTAGLVRRYRPDLIMLDNSEFFETPSGVTCCCEGCQAAFRRYITERFGDKVDGRPAASVRIPTERGFLYDVWLAWRNRVWGEANETFRRELRKVKPDIVVMSNTQYLRDKPDLATDLIYDHEDALISESVGMAMDDMINKLLLGRALAKGKPLWNYLGTFQEKDNALLVPPDAVAMNVSTAYACGVRPWVVYYGFAEKTEVNKPSLERMASVMAWHNSQSSEGEALTPYAPVLSLVSLNSRNYRLSKLIPGHLVQLRRRGITSWIIEEKAVEQGVPADCRVLILEDVPCLPDRAAGVIAEFVKAGGILVASPESANYDELGRRRPGSALWKILGVGGTEMGRFKAGRGELVRTSFPAMGSELAGLLEPFRFSVPEGAAISIIPYTDARGRFVAYVCSEQPLGKDLKVTAPGRKPGRAVVCSSEKPTPSVIPLKTSS
jgi:hypothetical protein